MIGRSLLYLILSSLISIMPGAIPAAEDIPAGEKKVTSPITPPLGLPAIPWPKDNPYSPEKVKLGQLLYFDTRLSGDNSVSCATCHNIPCAYSDCRAIAVGIDKKHGTRHSPTIINAAYSKYLFWDGRAASLEQQALGPLANPNEMALIDNVHEAYRLCESRIRDIKGYQLLFKEVFGTEKITMDHISQAIATFERTILSGNSPYDKFVKGDRTAMTQEQIRGFELYKKSGCINCHGGFNFADDRFMNIGVGMDSPNPDAGRYNVTHKDSDWGAFKVPTMRESEHTAPYMHNGSLKTLEEVIDYYDKGGIPNKNLHPLMHPLHLSPEDKKDLVAFLKALSGEGWNHFQEPASYPQ